MSEVIAEGTGWRIEHDVQGHIWWETGDVYRVHCVAMIAGTENLSNASGSTLEGALRALELDLAKLTNITADATETLRLKREATERSENDG